MCATLGASCVLEEPLRERERESVHLGGEKKKKIFFRRSSEALRVERERDPYVRSTCTYSVHTQSQVSQQTTSTTHHMNNESTPSQRKLHRGLRPKPASERHVVGKARKMRPRLSLRDPPRGADAKDISPERKRATSHRPSRCIETHNRTLRVRDWRTTSCDGSRRSCPSAKN